MLLLENRFYRIVVSLLDKNNIAVRKGLKINFYIFKFHDRFCLQKHLPNPIPVDPN